jgi:hypothetical protein
MGLTSTPTAAAAGTGDCVAAGVAAAVGEALVETAAGEGVGEGDLEAPGALQAPARAAVTKSAASLATDLAAKCDPITSAT